MGVHCNTAYTLWIGVALFLETKQPCFSNPVQSPRDTDEHYVTDSLFIKLHSIMVKVRRRVIGV